MKYKKLGHTDITISQLCLGSMTWGTQNTYAEACDQIECAIDAGVNVIDTAELYPATPISASTQGRTEEFIGKWLTESGRRNELILASKVAGSGPKWIDGGKAIDSTKIRKSIDGSLKRLNTDVIDLYQLHWPNRGSYHFRQSWSFRPEKQQRDVLEEHIIDVLDCLNSLIGDGKIRCVGLSNESCWGTAKFLSVAKENNLPRVVSVQNEYSLLHRLFDLDFAELSHHENVGLLAFSPLACGMLTGKYDNHEIPSGSRRTIADTLTGRFSDRSITAMRRYNELARDNALQPAQLALAFCLSKPFMTSAILGATSLSQLRENLQAASIELSESILTDIGEIHRDFPIPL